MNSITQTDLYAQARASELEPYRSRLTGNLLAQVLCLKSNLNSLEKSNAKLCQGPDGEALRKAFVALGYADEDFCAVRCDEMLKPQDLLFIIEAIAPLMVVSLDGASRLMLCKAYGMQDFDYGILQQCRGRRFVAVDSFEEALSDPNKKRIAWAQLKAAKRFRPLV